MLFIVNNIKLLTLSKVEHVSY